MKNSRDCINSENTYLNEYLGAQNREDFKAQYDEKIKNARLKRKVQKNASRIIEIVITTSHDFSGGWEQDKALKGKTNDYLHESLKYFENRFGEDVIISAAAHWDETTPHIHLLCIPLIKDESGNRKYSSSGFIGGPAEFAKLHTDFYEQVGKNHGLSRGVEGSRATHEGLKAFNAKKEELLRQTEADRRTAKQAREQALLEKQRAETLRRKMEAVKEMTEADSAEKVQKVMDEALLEKQKAGELRRRVEEENRRAEESRQKAEKERQSAEAERKDAELLKTQTFKLHGDAMRRSAELSQKEREQRKLADKAIRETAAFPPVPEKADKTLLASWGDSIQKKVGDIIMGFKSAAKDLQSKIHELKQTIIKLQEENTGLRNRAEKAEHDLVSKPIAEIISEREKKVQGRNDRQKVIRK
jgi:hypothetical protein